MQPLTIQTSFLGKCRSCGHGYGRANTAWNHWKYFVVNLEKTPVQMLVLLTGEPTSQFRWLENICLGLHHPCFSCLLNRHTSRGKHLPRTPVGTKRGHSTEQPPPPGTASSGYGASARLSQRSLDEHGFVDFAFRKGILGSDRAKSRSAHRGCLTSHHPAFDQRHVCTLNTKD